MILITCRCWNFWYWVTNQQGSRFPLSKYRCLVWIKVATSGILGVSEWVFLFRPRAGFLRSAYARIQLSINQSYHWYCIALCIACYYRALCICTQKTYWSVSRLWVLSIHPSHLISSHLNRSRPDSLRPIGCPPILTPTDPCSRVPGKRSPRSPSTKREEANTVWPQDVGPNRSGEQHPLSLSLYRGEERSHGETASWRRAFRGRRWSESVHYLPRVAQLVSTKVMELFISNVYRYAVYIVGCVGGFFSQEFIASACLMWLAGMFYCLCLSIFRVARKYSRR